MSGIDEQNNFPYCNVCKDLMRYWVFYTESLGEDDSKVLGFLNSPEFVKSSECKKVEVLSEFSYLTTYKKFELWISGIGCVRCSDEIPFHYLEHQGIMEYLKRNWYTKTILEIP